MTETGHLRLDGHPELYASPSGAAYAASLIPGARGWLVWRLPNGEALESLRHA